jgi:hypothetical protein
MLIIMAILAINLGVAGIRLRQFPIKTVTLDGVTTVLYADGKWEIRLDSGYRWTFRPTLGSLSEAWWPAALTVTITVCAITSGMRIRKKAPQAG